MRRLDVHTQPPILLNAQSDYINSTLRLALDEVVDAVLVTDEVGRFIYFNKGFVSFHRNKLEDFKLSTSDYVQIFEATGPDGRPVPFESWPVSRALRGETGTDQEYRILRRDTGESWVGRYNFSPIRGPDGKISGAVVIGRDITEGKITAKKLKDSESRARVMLEKSTELIVGLNLDGTYWFVNDAYARLLQTTPENIIGRSVSDLLPSHRAEERLKALSAAIEGRQKQTVELTITDGNGNERLFLTNVEPIFDDGSPERVIFVAIEITERKVAEIRLAESEVKYRRLFEQNSDALLLLDCETSEILDANPAAEALYGYSRKELVGRKAINLAANPQDFELAILSASLEGSFFTPYHRHLKKDGSVFPVEMSMTPFQLGNRAVVQPIIRDISERRRVQDRLQEISWRLQLATHSAKIGIWDWDIQSDTILWDDRMHELYGKPKGAGIGKKGVHEWAELIHPEDRERVFRECVSATEHRENVYDTEFRVIHPDGSIKYLKANGLVVWNDDGTAARMIGTNADITKQKEAETSLRKAYSEIEATVRSRTTELTREGERLKESERRLKKAQELGRIGHWATTISQHQTEWSDEVYRIFGFEPQSVKPSRELFESLILPESRNEIRKVIERAFREGKSYDMTFPFRRPDGTVGIAQSMAEVECDKDGKPFKYSGVLQDVTEQKTLEQELRSAVELRDEFMSIASHELKTPLTALNMQLQLLERLVYKTDSVGDRRILQMSKGALNSVKSLSNLIDDLLDVTRIRAGKLSLCKEDVDLVSLLEKTIAEMQPEAHRARTQIIFLGSEPVLGEWDLARIAQVIRNLISNAIKYGLGSPVIVNLIHDESDAWITVKDDGIGISRELQSQIFERFQRASTGKEITGLGLGLYIVRQIIEAHGGSIQVESESNKGSLFTVKIPRGHK